MKRASRRNSEMRFQRTYEELKHDRSEWTDFRAWGFQRTYEELKQKCDGCRDCSGNSFQRTYEELKPDSQSLSNPRSEVFSVPMRN